MPFQGRKLEEGYDRWHLNVIRLFASYLCFESRGFQVNEQTFLVFTKTFRRMLPNQIFRVASTIEMTRGQWSNNRPAKHCFLREWNIMQPGIQKQKPVLLHMVTPTSKREQTIDVLLFIDFFS